MTDLYSSRVHIVTAEDDSHFYTVPGPDAKEIVRSGLALACSSPFHGYIKTIRLTVSSSELTERYDLRKLRNKRPRPGKRAPDSSTGGGDQGLRPIIGTHRTLRFPRYVEA